MLRVVPLLVDLCRCRDGRSGWVGRKEGQARGCVCLGSCFDTLRSTSTRKQRPQRERCRRRDWCRWSGRDKVVGGRGEGRQGPGASCLGARKCNANTACLLNSNGADRVVDDVSARAPPPTTATNLSQKENQCLFHLAIAQPFTPASPTMSGYQGGGAASSFGGGIPRAQPPMEYICAGECAGCAAGRRTWA